MIFRYLATIQSCRHEAGLLCVFYLSLCLWICWNQFPLCNFWRNESYLRQTALLVKTWWCCFTWRSPSVSCVFFCFWKDHLFCGIVTLRLIPLFDFSSAVTDYPLVSLEIKALWKFVLLEKGNGSGWREWVLLNYCLVKAARVVLSLLRQWKEYREEKHRLFWNFWNPSHNKTYFLRVLPEKRDVDSLKKPYKVRERWGRHC